VAVFSALGLRIHFEHAALTWCIVLAALFIVLLIGYVAHVAYTSVVQRTRETMWIGLLFATSALMWIAAVVFGCVLYGSFSSYYNVVSLSTYEAIDPSRTHGETMMDVGRVIFDEGAMLDLSKGGSFSHDEISCVVPITKGAAPLAAYDFWAVGTNCCNSLGSEYTCDNFHDSTVHGGLRLMDENKQVYYRLAVQQAEAHYNIQALHPLFFEWTQDPIGATNKLRDHGLKHYVFGLSAALAVQFAIFAIITVITVKPMPAEEGQSY